MDEHILGHGRQRLQGGQGRTARGGEDVFACLDEIDRGDRARRLQGRQHLDDPFVDRVALETPGAATGLQRRGVVGLHVGVGSAADGQRLVCAGKPGEVMRLDAADPQHRPGGR